MRDALADRDLRRRVRDGERLPIGVHRDEVDLRDAGVDHAVDRVQAGAADADDADRGDVGGALRRRHAVELRRRLEHRLEVARGGARGGLGRDLLGSGSLTGAAVETGGAGSRHGRRRGGLRLAREVGDVLDGLVERCLGARVDGLPARRSARALLGALRRLGLAEELRERALTHRRALARHRAPPSRGRGTPGRPARTGRT